MHTHKYTCSTLSDIICRNCSAFVQTGSQDEYARNTQSTHII